MCVMDIHHTRRLVAGLPDAAINSTAGLAEAARVEVTTEESMAP